MLIEQADKHGIKLTVVSTRRSCDEQRAIYAQGRTAPGTIISGANGCRSWHVWGRAVDFLIVDDQGHVVTNGWDERYDELGSIAEGLGMIWGGKFSWGRDAGHFEYHPGVSIQQVCPAPESCEYSIAQPWPGDGTDPKPPEDDGDTDVSYTLSDEPSTSLALPIAATAVVIAAGVLWWRTLRSTPSTS